MANRDLGNQRREYVAKSLRRADLAKSPFDQFARWYADAEKHHQGYPNPMVLSTADSSGQPYSRVVLLKSFDEQGFVFYTNYESRKGVQIAENARVSLLFFWEPLERQICIQGTAKKYDSNAADDYFASRPRGSQISASISNQSQVIQSRELLEQRRRELNSKFEGKAVPRPENWGGYLVSPGSIEFWQGQPDRLHDRLVYSRDPVDSSDQDNKSNKAAVWTISRLSP